MAKKLAITISGAVSLGSYEAGVLYEIIYAIGCHNAAVTPDQRIEIDVLTGASAGGMTAAIATQKLLYEASSLSQAYNNSFYCPWVKDITLDALLALQPGEDPTHSLLSNNVVEDISRKYLTDRYSSPVMATAMKHPAASEQIYLGLALANLNGVDYQRTMRRGVFCYTCYQDQMTKQLSLHNPQDDTRDTWEVLRQAAVSCGAFPFAFHPKDLIRDQSEYTDPSPVAFPSPTYSFTYTDGGTFQNEPLGLAKHLVDKIDSHVNTANRFYMFVAPGARSSTANSVFREKNATLVSTAQQISSAVFNQARFQDWIKAEGVNDQINKLNTRATALMDVVINDPQQAEALSSATTALLTILFDNDQSAIETARQRLKLQYGQEYNNISKKIDPRAADSWVDTILTLEKAGDLGEKDEMDIYGITADDHEFAGGQLEAFLGFFDQSYRDHDYDVGRTKAREFINELNTKGYPLGPITYDQGANPIRPIDHNLDGMTMSEVPIELRKRYEEQISQNINNILKQMNVSWIRRKAMENFVIVPQLHKLFSL